MIHPPVPYCKKRGSHESQLDLAVTSNELAHPEIAFTATDVCKHRSDYPDAHEIFDSTVPRERENPIHLVHGRHGMIEALGSPHGIADAGALGVWVL